MSRSAYPTHRPTRMGRTFGLLAFIRFQELIIAESRSDVITDIQGLQIICLDTHMVAVSLDSELGGLRLNEIREQKFFHSVEIVA